MQLGALVDGLDSVAATQNVSGFAIDHRKVAAGDVFGAFRGANFNAEDYIPGAIAAGAIAIVASGSAQVDGAVHIVDDNPRRIFAQLAAKFYQPVPAHIAAITGTNGKTSVAELTRQLWSIGGHNAASIGTLGITTAQGQQKTGLTSPDIVTFLSGMAGLAAEGVDHVAYEASSHGLSQYRSEGLPVQIAAFTNLSRDHLDYHKDMDDYFAAKMRLFDEVVDDTGTVIIWADDEWSAKAADHALARGLKLLTVGQGGEFIQITGRSATQLGQDIEIQTDGARRHLHLPLVGEYQAANALISAAIVIAGGEDVDAVLENISRLQPVKGRLECAVITRAGAPVYVDYAHTPDALRAAIAALRPHVRGQLITIYGAGGDRDVGKRPEMGRVVESDSDIGIITDDNPRSEDPDIIRAQIKASAPKSLEIADRRSAIQKAIEMAGAGDIILLAGKGHEEGQIVKDRVIAFNDVEVARECAA